MVELRDNQLYKPGLRCDAYCLSKKLLSKEKHKIKLSNIKTACLNEYPRTGHEQGPAAVINRHGTGINQNRFCEKIKFILCQNKVK